MNPALDQLLVAALICGAVAFFVVRFLRKRRNGRACGGDCCAVRKREADL